MLRHLFALLMVLAASPLRAEVAAVIDDTTERFVLRHVHNEVFGRLNLSGFGHGDQVQPYTPEYELAKCENLGSRQIATARQKHLNMQVLIARYNLVRLWTQDLCHGKSDVTPSPAEAKAWLLELTEVKAGEWPLLDTHEMLAEVYLFGAPGVPPDYPTGLIYLNREAKQEKSKMNFGRVALTMSYVFEHGMGVLVDLARAREWLQRSVDAGNWYAKILMAQATELGLDVNRDEAAAFSAYQQLSGNNTASIWFRLGVMYLDGRGTSKDPCKAQDLFTKVSQADRGPIVNAKKHLDQIRQQNLCPADPLHPPSKSN